MIKELYKCIKTTIVQHYNHVLVNIVDHYGLWVLAFGSKVYENVKYESYKLRQ